jgi:hypothetical protein
MKVCAVFLCVAALLVFEQANAQVTLDPQSPRPFELLRVKASGSTLGPDAMGQADNYDPANTQVTMVGNHIVVSPLMKGHTDFGGVPTPPLDQVIGALPPGDYQLEVVKRATGTGSAGRVGDVVAFSVPQRAAAEPLADFTDLWWNPAESGWGIGLFHHPTNQIFVTLFVYGTDGKPLWYVISSGEFSDPVTYRGQIYKTTGPYFGLPFDPAQFHIAPAGAGEIVFDTYDLDKATIDFTIDGIRFVKAIQRQGF